MNADAAKVEKLLRQQAAIAGFGSFALRQTDMLKVLTEAARVCAEGLSVKFSKVCRYRPAENDMFVEAGHGWKAGVVGHVVSRADESSPQGRAFVTGRPSICNDLRTDTNFVLPALYAQHGIISTIDVVIKGEDKPYGVLEIDNDEQHDYDEHDIDFLTGFANVLAEAVATAARMATLHSTIAQMQILLDQKKVLAEELQHRVRNNLQLVYDHLLGNEMTRTTDFSAYVNSLCRSLEEIQAGAVTLGRDCDDALILDLDVVTALGIVVAELVTNSYDHAFPGGTGAIIVSVHRDATDPDRATLIVSDNGAGLKINGENKRHGIGLVRRLVEQVDGAALLDTARGTTWTINFPAPRATELATAA